eukprot:scaffold130224_cov32-Tisochrysis_lutea.AAC.2
MSVIGIGPVAICSSTLYRQPTVAWWPAHASGARADLTVERHRIIISANFEARHGANGLVGEQGESSVFLRPPSPRGAVIPRIMLSQCLTNIQGTEPLEVVLRFGSNCYVTTQLSPLAALVDRH